MQAACVLTAPRAVDALTRTVLDNLQYQHGWTDMKIYDQVRALAQEADVCEKTELKAEPEWILPMRLIERWSPAEFDNVLALVNRTKSGVHSGRILIAALDNDSTVVYYFIHQGIVKPRQN